MTPLSLVAWLILCSSGLAADPGGTSSLPVVHIETGEDSITSQGVVAKFGIADHPGGTGFSDLPDAYSGFADVNIHGTSSSGMDKKSYAIELTDSVGNEAKAPLLGMSAESKWVLVASFPDKSLIRNAFAYAMATAAGRYAPRNRLVELVLNGGYEGVYLLVERIQRDSARVDVSKLGPADTLGDGLTGGYILRVDRSSDGNGWASSSDSLVYFQYQYPSEQKLSRHQREYIRWYVDGFERAMSSSGFADPDTGYSRWIDVGSFVDYLLLEELVKNVDGYRLSGYLHKQKDSKGGKLRAGPVWDLDFSAGMPDYYNGWKSAGWIYEWDARASNDGAAIPFWWKKLAKESGFRSTLACRWKGLRAGEWSNTSWKARFDSLAAVAGSAQARNFKRWDVLDRGMWPEVYVPGTYQGEIDTMKNWLSARIAWIDGQLSSKCRDPIGVRSRGSAKDDVFRLRDGRIEWDSAPERIRLDAPDGRSVAMEGRGSMDVAGLASGVWIVSWQRAPGDAWASRPFLKR